MAKSQQTYNKKEKEKKRLKKRKDKLEKKEERKANSTGGDFDSMIAYVDENGMITDTPPDPTKKKRVIKAENIEIGVPKREEEAEEDKIRQGKVSFFDGSKGFGFILDMKSQEKFFVHVSGLIDEVGEDDKVTFELEKGMKGMNAVKVKLMS
ncbi:cold shock domain-containing protein [Vicingus serpentipes]|jgi:cold shock CspA family protein|uniref:Cold shock domain-containing protein n=1 Tax=Vicingus serpentipes TaxID=1926625 RepID=A0A5C6RW99_9FLAO|nr:cold shock domain-containing protein [Vicingus serpentipes]TXB65860.1 cold shock domain-containing protein [Vicingus serpentipes]